MKFDNFIKYSHYYLFISIGILIIMGVAVKLLNIYSFSSDWFWLLAAIGLIIEGAISLIKQKKFDRKYKIIEKAKENI